ncbi:tyrosine-type recombinase/integrase [Sphingomonas solaris]|uniref:Tyrosine-type recombinase/integrase n=1 Tax=Alterirhizorhabdus solaris TaxID=2529389 RepID=A0A558R9H3_9SPHN|nr:site-specific integrase [Sphingomonas solaris]TVV76024.1 tyrosine-type recombinase/integrase [Sphingomonas solaris]
MATRTLNKLDPRTAATIKTAGRHSDGGGLYLSIDPTGRRRWVFMYTRDGKRTELGLGGGRDLTLANARKEATTLRAIHASGGDPRAAREKQERQTFGEVADAYLEAMRPSWRNAKHAAQWTMTLTKYAAPIRPRMVETIGIRDILEVLQPLWQRTPETAERLRGRLENVLDAAKAKGLRTGENPARWRGHLDQLLPKRQRLSRGHHTALPYADVPTFMADLREREAMAARALEFVILTAARSGEVLGATWAEIDLEGAVWTVPAARMKAGREHRVPLSGRAGELLEGLSGARDAETAKPGDPVFAGPKGKPLSSMAMAMLLRRMGSAVTAHGFRSAFRDWASETTGFPHEVCEMALAHTIGNKAEAAYRRGDLFNKRRGLMDAWAGYCGEDAGNVVRLAAA